MTGVNRTPPFDWLRVAGLVAVAWSAASVLLILARLFHLVHLSWLATLAPLWGPLAALGVFVVVLLVVSRKSVSQYDVP